MIFSSKIRIYRKFVYGPGTNRSQFSVFLTRWHPEMRGSHKKRPGQGFKREKNHRQLSNISFKIIINVVRHSFYICIRFIYVYVCCINKFSILHQIFLKNSRFDYIWLESAMRSIGSEKNLIYLFWKRLDNWQDVDYMLMATFPLYWRSKAVIWSNPLVLLSFSVNHMSCSLG